MIPTHSRAARGHQKDLAMKHSGKLMRQSAELALAAPQVVALRLTGMLAGGLTPDVRTRGEYARMGIEKAIAAQQSLAAMSWQLFQLQQQWALHAMTQWLRVFAAPAMGTLGAQRAFQAVPALSWLPVAGGAALGSPAVEMQRALVRIAQHGLAPVHRRATANLRRLRKR